MSAPSGRVVRNLQDGTRLVADAVDGADVALRAQAVDVAETLPGTSADATARAVEFSTPFDYLFDTLASKFPAKHLPGDAATVVPQLKALGRAMIENEPPQGGELQSPGNSTIPPVYTYWGQFIDHDITLNTDSNKGVSDITQSDLAPLTPSFVTTHLHNGRQPALNLDSLYGDGPTFPGGPTTEAASMYDGLALKLSNVADNLLIPGEHVTADPQRDLFRDQTRVDDPNTPDVDAAVAVIGDSRNDENLIVAQLHVAFVRFHNAVLAAGQAQPDAPTDRQELFARVRQLVTWHYQWLVVALFDGTGLTTLPFNWVIEWDRFVDKGSSRPDHFARKIDTQLAPPLHDMLNQISRNEGSFPVAIRELLARLAIRNLLRGYSLALPTGQAVAEELGITPLTPEQLQSGNTASFNTVLRDGGFETATPLWYYVLKEAEVLGGGNSLGPVGSRIVVETLVGQLRADPDSFLNAPDDWSPEQGVLLPDGSPIVSINDLFRFAGVA